jgi:hypothetical protein
MATFSSAQIREVLEAGNKKAAPDAAASNEKVEELANFLAQQFGSTPQECKRLNGAFLHFELGRDAIYCYTDKGQVVLVPPGPLNKSKFITKADLYYFPYTRKEETKPIALVTVDEANGAYLLANALARQAANNKRTTETIAAEKKGFEALSRE